MKDRTELTVSSIERAGDKKTNYRIGIKWKMYAIIVVFILCVLISVWFVQVRMLNVFYQSAKFYELEQSADDIAMSLSNEVDAKNKAIYYSGEYALDIWILRISNKRGEWVIRSDSSSSSLLPFLANKMEALYSQASENGGRYIATVPEDSFSTDFSIRILEDNKGDNDGFPKITEYSDAIGTLYARIVNLDGKEYMIVQHANLSPLQTTVSTLKYQFFSIGIGMIIMALLLAAILSKLITKPFVKMNEAAKKLAAGNYDADFSEKGYREIEELSKTLNFASRELAKTDKLQKELISNISHDLRTPLTMIKGYSEVMRDIPGENTPENVQVIIDETARLSDLVNDMLDLSKIQSGTRSPKYETFCITQLVRQTLARYEKLIMQDRYKIEFITDCEAEVYADSVMILQVIYNLINNAINYTGEDKYVRVEQKTTDVSVHISVTDTGEGIRKEDMASVWERYYRVDKIHKRATVGTGLGLSIVKGILESHSAKYGIESTPQIGATFWFELDRVKFFDTTPKIIDAEYDSTEYGEK